MLWREIIQEIALSGLYRAGFFDRAAFVWRNSPAQFFMDCGGFRKIWIFSLLGAGS